MTDPIADMLTRIRNAQLAAKEEVRIPFSKLKYNIAKILEENKFIERADRTGRQARKSIKIYLKYTHGKPAISGLRRVSKPGRRVYLPVKKIKRVKEGYGIAIISTPKGLMTDKEARRQKVGGEILCEIW
ncbi:30S ribosomal protein S8 [bacterium]|nr:30S ribosomal protein S8 [bacterium]